MMSSSGWLVRQSELRRETLRIGVSPPDLAEQHRLEIGADRLGGLVEFVEADAEMNGRRDEIAKVEIGAGGIERRLRQVEVGAHLGGGRPGPERSSKRVGVGENGSAQLGEPVAGIPEGDRYELLAETHLPPE